MLGVLLSIVLGGCAGLQLPQVEWVRLETSTSTQYYPVRGSTAAAIFGELDDYRLVDAGGRRAVGLTTGRWSLDWSSTGTSHGGCRPGSLTITLHLVVTLPQHERASDLPPDVRASWERFVARVAAHEQRHVDIFLDGAKTMQSGMAEILRRPSSCSELERGIQRFWTSHQAHIEAAQDQFHLEDATQLQNDRAPLETQIGANRARLDALESEARALDLVLSDLERRVDTMHAAIDTVKAQLAQVSGPRPPCAQARPGSPLQALCEQHESLIATQRGLVEQRNGMVQRRDTLADEQRSLVTITNGLIEALNWTQ